VVVFDYHSSIGDELSYLTAEFKDIVGAIEEANPGV